MALKPSVKPWARLSQIKGRDIDGGHHLSQSALFQIRQTLQLLRDQGIEPKIVEYLESPPKASELDDILKKLKLEPRDAMRKKEAPYKKTTWPMRRSRAPN